MIINQIACPAGLFLGSHETPCTGTVSQGEWNVLPCLGTEVPDWSLSGFVVSHGDIEIVGLSGVSPAYISHPGEQSCDSV